MSLRVAALVLLGQQATVRGQPCADATQSGMIGLVTDISPACFEAGTGCPELCGPIDEVIAKYLSTGDVDSVKGTVCQYRQQFNCLYDDAHIGVCQKVLDEARDSYQLALPTSSSDLQTQCDSYVGRLANTTVGDQPQAVVALAARPQQLLRGKAVSQAPPCAGATQSGVIGMVTEISPECFEPGTGCPQLCGPIDGIVAAFLAGGTELTVKQKVCEDAAAFSCMFAPVQNKACQVVLDKARSDFNVALPSSAADLAAQCAALRPANRDVDVNTTTTQAPAATTTIPSKIATGAAHSSTLRGLASAVVALALLARAA